MVNRISQQKKPSWKQRALQAEQQVRRMLKSLDITNVKHRQVVALLKAATHEAGGTLTINDAKTDPHGNSSLPEIEVDWNQETGVCILTLEETENE